MNRRVSQARLLSITVGLPRWIDPLADDAQTAAQGRPWRTAIYKEPVRGPIWVGREGLHGDGQANRKYHGGPERAVLIYSAEHYPIWCRELGLPALAWGSFGENLTVSELTEASVRLEQRLAIGDVVLQVASARQPCRNLARRLDVTDIVARVRRTARSGWYCRVLQEGYIEPGLPLQLLDDPTDGLGATVAAALQKRQNS
jgi:MOSC domain-containing protein YiiM